ATTAREWVVAPTLPGGRVSEMHGASETPPEILGEGRMPTTSCRGHGTQFRYGNIPSLTLPARPLRRCRPSEPRPRGSGLSPPRSLAVASRKKSRAPVADRATTAREWVVAPTLPGGRVSEMHGASETPTEPRP